MREEFVIHPGASAHIISRGSFKNGTGRSQAGVGSVVGRLPRTFSFLADSILTVSHWPLFRVHQEFKGEALFQRSQLHILALPLDFPVAVPYLLLRGVHTRQPGPGTIGSLDMVKLSAIEIA